MWVDILKGIGSLAQAGATLYGAKKQSKIQKEMLEDKKRRDIIADKKLAHTENNLNSAINDIYDGDKKKKKKNLSEGIDLSQAYGS